MSMTLEQVIADCKEEISDCQIDLDGISELLEKHPERKEAFAHDIDDYKKRMDYNRQLAEWLRELQERRKAPKIVHCGECAFCRPFLSDKVCSLGLLHNINSNMDFCSRAVRKPERRTE